MSCFSCNSDSLPQDGFYCMQLMFPSIEGHEDRKIGTHDQMEMSINILFSQQFLLSAKIMNPIGCHIREGKN